MAMLSNAKDTIETIMTLKREGLEPWRVKVVSKAAVD